MQADMTMTESYSSQLSIYPLNGLLFKARMYSMLDKSSNSQDPLSVKGLSKLLYENVVNLLEKLNLPRFNKELIESYNYLKIYYLSKYEIELNQNKSLAKLNLDKAIFYAEKIISLDPENTEAIKELSKLIIINNY